MPEVTQAPGESGKDRIQPTGVPNLVWSANFQHNYDAAGALSAGIRIPDRVARPELNVDDPDYTGPLTRVTCNAGDPGGGGGGLVSVVSFYDLEGRVGDKVTTIAQVDRQNAVNYVYQEGMTPSEIADAVESAATSIQRGDTRHDYKVVYSLYATLPPEEIRRRGIPEEQIVRDASGKPVQNEHGIKVIQGRFEYSNRQSPTA